MVQGHEYVQRTGFGPVSAGPHEQRYWSTALVHCDQGGEDRLLLALGYGHWCFVVWSLAVVLTNCRVIVRICGLIWIWFKQVW